MVYTKINLTPLKLYRWLYYLPIGMLLFIGLVINYFYGVQIKYHIRQSKQTDNESVSEFINHTILDNHIVIEYPFTIAVANNLLHILPRAVFFDNRVRGKNQNATVILAHWNKAKLVACKVNGYYTTAFEIKSLTINGWLHVRHPECTHDNILIFCYNMPAVNNSKVSIIYADSENSSDYIAIESEHPLFIPKETESRLSVMACTTVFDTPPHFGAWIRYQKTLGVDMVYIHAQESFLNSSSYNDPFFHESLHNGFIQFKVWKEHLEPGAVFYHSQALFYQDCLYRYLGVHEYCICGDTDDFFTSGNDTDFDVHKLVGKIFHKESIGSSPMKWIRYIEPAGGFNPPEETIADGNLVRYVDTSRGKREGRLTKSIYKLSAMLELGIHFSSQFLSHSDYHWTTTPPTVAYMAHIKKTPAKIKSMY